MLGGGNPVGGGNPAGIGQTLNYIGDRVYAYSGDLQALSGGQTFLKFTTGSELIVAMFQFYNSQDDSTATEWQIFIDSQEVVGYFSEGRIQEGYNFIKLILPPYTTLEVKGTNAGNKRGAAIMTGKVIA